MRRVADADTLWAYDPSAVGLEGRLTLLDNVQFIYELALAQMELSALGAAYRVTNGLRVFELLAAEGTENLVRRSAYFKYVGRESTDYYKIIQKNTTRSVNQYLTHWIYPYKGKFHPQMIRALMNVAGLKAGETVLDPFIGSGTTAVEAQLLGINCVGIDVSPLCVLQSKVKTESVYVWDEIIEKREVVARSIGNPLFNRPGSGGRRRRNFRTNGRRIFLRWRSWSRSATTRAAAATSSGRSGRTLPRWLLRLGITATSRTNWV